ncbi:hypothetical protein GCM10011428_59910 [Streptomyces violaceus]
MEHDIGVRKFGQQRCGQFPGPFRQVSVGHEKKTHALSLEAAARSTLGIDLTANRQTVQLSCRIDADDHGQVSKGEAALSTGLASGNTQ